MNTYTETNPPRRGRALKIWRALERAGYKINDLHYNPNLWGLRPELGWGSWACSVIDKKIGGGDREYLCGWNDERGAYLQAMNAPFAVVFLTQDGEKAQ